MSRTWPTARSIAVGVSAGAVVFGVISLVAPEPAARVPYTTAEQTERWLRSHHMDYELALARATRWLEPLAVDPEELRAHGIKGKKKLVELIDFWARLHAIADPTDQPRILRHIDQLAAVTRSERYHDMLRVDDRQFKQDATSYLRAAYLLDRLGLDVALYREEIRRVQPRLDAHLPARGPSQRRMFHVYYGYFGLTEPFPLASALEDGIIAHRRPAASLDRFDAYHLTHEIFALYDYGDDLAADPFDDAELTYLRSVLPEVMDDYIRQDDPDLVAEVLSCLRYIRAVDLEAYPRGLAYLLGKQHPDGHWGDYEPEREVIGAWATTYKLELHTTGVALDALTVAFHRPWNQAVEPLVP